MSIIEEEWNLNISLEEIEFSSFVQFLNGFSNICENINTLLANSFKPGHPNKPTTTGQSYDEELRYFSEKNKVLKQEIDLLTDQVSKKQQQYEEHKRDVKLFEQEIKDRHEAFLMAKKNYKKLLKIYFSIESKNIGKEIIFVQFFTEARKESENYSVRLLRDPKMGRYQILSSTPGFEELKEIQRTLQETNDVPGALCRVRQVFKDLKSNKKT